MRQRTMSAPGGSMLRCTLAVPVALALLCLLPLIAGCPNTVPVKQFNETQQQLQLAREQVNNLQSQISDEQEQIRNLQQQVNAARQIKLSPDDLIVPVKIQLARNSGGYNADHKPGDVGIVLYIEPIDRDGDVIKAAGTIQVKLYDLQAPPGETLIGEYHFDANKTRSLWYGRLWTHFFAVHCPWPQGRTPRHNLITADVLFTDLLTGALLRTQGAFHVQLPPELKP